MKKNTSHVLTFILGSIFGAFIAFNFMQPKSISKNAVSDDLKIKRFDKDFDIKGIDKKNLRRKKSDSGQMDQDIDDLKNQMDNVFKNSGGLFKLLEDSIQESTMEAMGVNIGEIVEKVTKDAVILELDVTNIDNSSLKIDVKDNQIIISGEARIEEKNESNSGSSKRVMVSSFSRTYPVPLGTRASGLKIENKNENTIQLIFPKVQ